MLSKNLNISSAFFSLALLMGIALTTSAQAMEKEEPAKKSLCQARKDFLKELGETAVKFHQEDPQRLNKSIPTQKNLEVYSLSSATTFFHIQISHTEIREKDSFFSFASLLSTKFDPNFSFSIKFPVSFFEKNLENKVNEFISSFKLENFSDNYNEFFTSQQELFIECPDKFRMYPNKFEQEVACRESSKPFETRCIAALEKAIHTIDLKKLAKEEHEGRYEIFKCLKAIDEKSLVSTLPIDVVKMIILKIWD